MFEYRDMFGREIKVGDFIVYAALADRSGVLRAGQVIELTQTKERWSEVVPKVRCKAWDNFRSQRTFNDRPTSGRTKDVTLGFLDRLIVVPEEVVSQIVKDELAGPIIDPWAAL